MKMLLPMLLLLLASCGELSNPLDNDSNDTNPVDNTDPVVSELESKGLRVIAKDGEFYQVEAKIPIILGA